MSKVAATPISEWQCRGKDVNADQIRQNISDYIARLQLINLNCVWYCIAIYVWLVHNRIPSTEVCHILGGLFDGHFPPCVVAILIQPMDALIFILLMELLFEIFKETETVIPLFINFVARSVFNLV